jgi:NTP pyrophosphatase (non-canonical NTP hydrolase)
MINKRTDIINTIALELDYAYSKHGSTPWSRHEFYAVLLEEVDELWEAIKKDQPQVDVTSEAIQIAAVVIRYLETGDRFPILTNSYEKIKS